MKKGIILLGIMLVILIPQNAYGMHIVEGFLAPNWCIFWFIISIPFIIFGLNKINKISTDDGKTKVLLGVAGAFIFLLSSLKIPSVTGSCSHMTGTGLGAIIFGPAITSVLGVIVLLFQTLLLAHGGLTTLGANTFSMGIAGPLLSYGLYKMLPKMNVNLSVTVFISTFLGSLFTYCVTATQLAVAFPSESGSILESFVKFISVFAITQLPLSIIEGIVSVFIFNFIKEYNKEELLTLNVLKRA